MTKWTPPPALVKKVQEKANRDAYSNAEYIDKESVAKVLTASGMGALVALIERVGALQKSSANPELFPIIDDARTLLATLGTPEREGR